MKKKLMDREVAARTNDNYKNPKEMTSLMVAVRENSVATVKMLLQNDADIKAVDDRGYNVLFYLIESYKTHLETLDRVYNSSYQQKNLLISNYMDIFDLLLKYKVPLDHLSYDKTSILILGAACRTDMPSLINCCPGLLNHINDSGISALSMACMSNNEHAVSALLEAGANVNLPDSQGMRPIVVAIKKNPLNLVIILNLLEAGANIDFVKQSDSFIFSSVIRQAVEQEHKKLIKFLIKKGISIQDDIQSTRVAENIYRSNDIALLTAQYVKNKGLILIAVQKNSSKMIDILLLAGVSVNVVYVKEVIDSQKVKRIRHIQVSYSLRGSSYYDSDTNEYFPDYVSEDEEYLEEVKGDTYLRTLAPLHIAVQNNDYSLVERLVKAGANVDQPITSDDGVTPLHMALNLKANSIAKLLIYLGANVNQIAKQPNGYYRLYKGAPKTNNCVPLYAAIQLKDLSLIQALLKKGADVNIHLKSNLKLIPLIEMAITEKLPEAVSLLIEAGAKLNYSTDTPLNGLSPNQNFDVFHKTPIKVTNNNNVSYDVEALRKEKKLKEKQAKMEIASLKKEPNEMKVKFAQIEKVQGQLFFNTSSVTRPSSSNAAYSLVEDDSFEDAIDQLKQQCPAFFVMASKNIRLEKVDKNIKIHIQANQYKATEKTLEQFGSALQKLFGKEEIHDWNNEDNTLQVTLSATGRVKKLEQFLLQLFQHLKSPTPLAQSTNQTAVSSYLTNTKK